jgi:hypothetical protein
MLHMRIISNFVPRFTCNISFPSNYDSYKANFAVSWKELHICGALAKGTGDPLTILARMHRTQLVPSDPLVRPIA